MELHALVKANRAIKTVLLGHSLGGLLVGLGAKIVNPNAMLLMATPWSKLSHTIENQMRFLLSEDGASEARIESTIAARRKMIAKVKQSGDQWLHTQFNQLER